MLKTLRRFLGSDPVGRIIDFGNWGSSDAGIEINRDSALTYAAVWRACNLISRDVAKLPLCVYRRVDGGKERATEHPAFRLLRQATDTIGPFQLKQTLMAHVLLEGNGYAAIQRNAALEPISLTPLSPTRTVLERKDGELRYITTVPGSGTRLKIKPADMLHIKGLGYDGLTGYSVVQYAANTIGLGLAAQKYGSKYFKLGSPSMLLQHPTRLSAKARQSLREEWAEMHEGLDNAHRPAILQEGMTASPLAMTAKDAQLIESRAFEIREVANWFGVPPHKLGDPTRTAYASLEQENQSYLDEALDGWLCAWEEELSAKLLSDGERHTDSHIIEFNRNALVRADMATRFASYNSALQSGWMNRDEVRARENMNAIPDGEGQEFLMPLNMGAVGATDGVS